MPAIVYAYRGVARAGAGADRPHCVGFFAAGASQRQSQRLRIQTCPFRNLCPAILMMQAAEDIACGDGSATLDWPVPRGVSA